LARLSCETIGEVVFTAADEANWRKGIWDTLSTFGMALMRGAAMGAAGGAVAGGMVEGVGFAGKKMRGASRLDDEAAGTLDRIGLAMDDLAALDLGQSQRLARIE
jgi:hypothetical protein